MRVFYQIVLADNETGFTARYIVVSCKRWGPMYVQGVDSLIEAEVKACAMASRITKADHAKIVSGLGTEEDPWVVEVSGTR